ncbi:hypothetical protein [Kosakonia sp. S42]|uniref:hypothetical protein n=1 Tax=Kosakonia sp. S42 TaxID=2767458 RepID=UPI0035C7A1B0
MLKVSQGAALSEEAARAQTIRFAEHKRDMPLPRVMPECGRAIEHQEHAPHVAFRKNVNQESTHERQTGNTIISYNNHIISFHLTPCSTCAGIHARAGGPAREIAAEYLLAHPDVLVQVSQKLQQQQHAREQLAMSL